MTTQKMPNLNVFGAKAKDEILVPDSPMAVRNNCQSGCWTLGDTDYGNKCSMTILKRAKFFGSLGQTQNCLWNQIWFVAESGELPQGVVLVTYIKSRSLSNFNNLVASVQAKGVEPATGLFVTEFSKHSGSKPDDNGVVKPINYYSLKWSWQERTDWVPIEKAAAVLSDPANLARMHDLEGTRYMICLDNLPPEEVAQLMAISSSGSEMALNSSRDSMALPASAF